MQHFHAIPSPFLHRNGFSNATRLMLSFFAAVMHFAAFFPLRVPAKVRRPLPMRRQLRRWARLHTSPDIAVTKAPSHRRSKARVTRQREVLSKTHLSIQFWDGHFCTYCFQSFDFSFQHCPHSFQAETMSTLQKFVPAAAIIGLSSASFLTGKREA